MPLVTSKELLERAKEEGYAIGAFNANNLENVQAVVDAAEEEKAPVILQISQGAIRYAGLEQAASMVKIAAELASVPVVLHLDHGTNFDQNVRCLRAGFTSLMYDGSKTPLEDNIAVTSKLVEIAHACDIPVEAELGRVAGTEDKFTPEEIEDLKTKPEQAAEFVERAQCDSLAVAVGSVHRMKTQEAVLDIDLIKRIKKETDIPLVLHGSSGVSLDSVKEGVAAGICKVNVATRISMAFLEGIKTAWDKNPDDFDFRKFFRVGKANATKVIRNYIQLLGSSGKAF